VLLQQRAMSEVLTRFRARTALR